jgi:prepilin-type N-terminal cleavage/methylation domain-containing protein
MPAANGRFPGEAGLGLRQTIHNKQPASAQVKSVFLKKFKGKSGFTLVELIAVIALISLMFFFTLPRFEGAVISDDIRKVSRWLIAKVQMLKHSAVKDQKNYVLYIDLDDRRLWVADQAADEEAVEEAAKKGYGLPDEVDVTEVAFPDGENLVSGRVRIVFYRNGYSDKAIIHIRDNDDRQMSLMIEPFLSQVKVFDEYVGF